ncbi:aminotransferase class IV [Candidatus Saccharibacteria bacterium]|nr:aminotransferase class IV [Candidatus Saccharibacteria bacterium]
MARLYPTVYFRGKLVPESEAQLSVASSAVLYGLSVYTVFHVAVKASNFYAFRLPDHYQRLLDSCKIIGIDAFDKEYSYNAFKKIMAKLVAANQPTENVFVRVSLHVDEKIPGTRSRGLTTVLSAFMYEAVPIVPREGVRLKTSVWRRTPDFSIPSRAKVNGAYVNSVLARQDAIDSGYDDCIFLDSLGHVAELSAANIFVVRNGVLLTPGHNADILEGINRRTVLEIAASLGVATDERSIDLTELYIADEVFVTGTSAFLSPVTTIDSRPIHHGPITKMLTTAYQDALLDPQKSTYLEML